ncbi:MAG: hypothetical protein KGI80_00495 [Verrucomicrobiota bacterium]|nr:hypothetical protein [Verrucomicrobiota bacterium]
MRWLFFLLPILGWAGSNSGSIMLLNDSSFILTATVQAADGTYLAQFTIQPGQQQTFTTNLWNTQYTHPGTPPVSLTPYTVIWQCASEEYYGVCSQVSPGSLCTPSQCPGNHFCKPKSGGHPASSIEEKD